MRIIKFIFCLFFTAVVFAHAGKSTGSTAKDLHESFAVKGGLIVHLGAGDCRLTAELSNNGAYTVHGLEPDAELVRKGRAYLREKGVYGRVSVSELKTSVLPYSDNLVNILVLSDRSDNSDLSDVKGDELKRVLAPFGQLFSTKELFEGSKKLKNGWYVYTKPWPKEIDDWPQYLHDATGNCVSRDLRIGPPRNLKWNAGPDWARNHNWINTLSAMVSEKGRIFYILDDAPPGATGMPDRWALYARDAFNGVLLWKIPISVWGWSSWSDNPLPGKGFSGSRGNGGRFTQPEQVQRTLFAVDDKVYVTLGYGSAVSEIDALTGKVLRVFEETENADELLYYDGLLIVGVHDQPVADKVEAKKKGAKVNIGKRIFAVDLNSGKTQWKSDSFEGVTTKHGFMDIHRHLNPSIGEDKIFLTGKKEIICLSLKDGKKLWAVPRPFIEPRFTRYDLLSTDHTTLVYHDGRIFFSQLEHPTRIGHREINAGLYAYSAKDGKQLWTKKCNSWGWVTAPDVFVIDGLVWVADIEPQWVGINPKDGTEMRAVTNKKAYDQSHHHRCYRNKATVRYMITSYHGMELFDMTGKKDADVNVWVRSACRYGFMPANGMIYSAPDPCGCYQDIKLRGFNALAGKRSAASGRKPVARLKKGAAFAKAMADKEVLDGNWSAFRHDSGRSGIASTKLQGKLKEKWKVDVGGVPTALTSAEGKVFLAVSDQLTVMALDAKNGKKAWEYPVGGRVDSPPTYSKGKVYFGSNDGDVYCLRAGDGALVWKFMAAPHDELITIDGLLESAWPVHGSVIVESGKLYAVAGRSTFLNGGFTAWVLDAEKGTVISEKKIDDSKIEFLGMKISNRSPVPGTMSDILSSDGAALYMKNEKVFSMKEGKGPAGRVKARAGFLDGSLFNRTSRYYWGKESLDDYAVANSKEAYSWQLYARNSFGDQFFNPRKDVYLLKGWEWGREVKGKPAPQVWKRELKATVRGMVKAGDTLCVAGMPHVIPADDPWKLHEGRGEGVLYTVDAKTGETIMEQKLEAAPVLHGAVVADGRLFLSLVNGTVCCFEAE